MIQKNNLFTEHQYLRPPIIIIGRGIGGLLMAYKLLDLDWPLMVIGKREEGLTASLAAQGLSAMKGKEIARDFLYESKLAGAKILKKILQTQRQLDPNFKMIEGVFEHLESGSYYQKYSKRSFGSSWRGGFKARVVGKKNEEVFRYFYPLDFAYDPRQFLISLEHFLTQKGVVFINDHVSWISKKGALHLSNTTEIANLKALVLSPGASGFDHFFQIKEQQNSKIKTKKGYSYEFNTQSNCEQAVIYGKKSKVAFKDKTLLGGWDEADHKNAHTFLDQNILDVEDRKRLRCLSGLRLYVDDRKPLVGEVFSMLPYPVYVSTAFYRDGYHLSGLCAEAIKSLLIEKIFLKKIADLEIIKILSNFGLNRVKFELRLKNV